MGNLPFPVAHKEHEVFLPFVQRCEDMTAALFAAAHGQAAVLDWALIHIIQLRSKLNTAEEAVRSMEETTRSMIDDIEIGRAHV